MASHARPARWAKRAPAKRANVARKARSAGTAARSTGISRNGAKGLILLGGIGAVIYAIYKNVASAAGTVGAAAPGVTPASVAAVTGGTLGLPSINPIALPSYSVNLPIQAGTQNIPELPAGSAVNAGQVAASNSFWNSLQPVGSLSSGYINFPSGAQAAATLFDTRMDGTNGNFYVQWAGQTYLVGDPDSSGNYPAMLAPVQG
jgi:hypothetical protein